MSRRVRTGLQDDARYNIRVLDRAISILTLMTDGKPRTPSEISDEIQLNYSTTFRLLSTLAFYRYLKRDEASNLYGLGIASLELAQAYLASNDIRRVALPTLESLRDETKETVHLVLMEDMEVVYLEKLPGLYAIGPMSSRVGMRAPAFCTGVGKVLLAYQKPETVQAYYQVHGLPRFTSNTITDLESLMSNLEEVRRAGYALDNGEHEDEVRCIAAPVFDITGQAVAAISIAGPSARMEPLEQNQPMIRLVRDAGLTISHQLGYAVPKTAI